MWGVGCWFVWVFGEGEGVRGWWGYGVEGGLKQREGQGSFCTATENLWPGISYTKPFRPVEFLKAASLCVVSLLLCLTWLVLKSKIGSGSITGKKSWSSCALCCQLNLWESDVKCYLGPFSSGQSKNDDVSLNLCSVPVVLSALVAVASGHSSYLTLVFWVWNCAN